MMMKRTLLITALTAVSLTFAGCNKTDSAAKAAKTTASTAASATVAGDTASEMDKISYILGHDAGKNLKEMDGQINPKIIAEALADGFEGKPSKYTDEQARTIFEAYQKRKTEEAVKEFEAKAAANKEAGAKFLAENAKKEGVKTTPSGLQYKVITEGTGPKPKATDTVVVNYEGKFIDGKVFDSSIERGVPASFQLGQMIKGWSEGLQLMPAGSKYELYIPSELAYGAENNPAIPPNSVLIFTVELLDEAAAKKAQADIKAKADAQMAEMMKQLEAAKATGAEAQPAAK